MDIDIGNSAKSRKNVGMVTCTVENRVRFAETDAMGVTHHANYLSWFEMSRVALTANWSRLAFSYPYSKPV
jgi:acyl-CoA thioesterase FadM